MTPQAATTTPQQAPRTHHFVPIADAVGILGLSATTIRRKIASGELVAEKLARPQGTAFLVQVPHDTPEGATTPQEPPETHHDVPPSYEYLAAVLAPLIATIERQAETIGRQSAELEALKMSSDETLSGRASAHAHLIPALAPWLLSALVFTALVVLLVGLGNFQIGN